MPGCHKSSYRTNPPSTTRKAFRIRTKTTTWQGRGELCPRSGFVIQHGRLEYRSPPLRRVCRRLRHRNPMWDSHNSPAGRYLRRKTPGLISPCLYLCLSRFPLLWPSQLSTSGPHPRIRMQEWLGTSQLTCPSPRYHDVGFSVGLVTGAFCSCAVYVHCMSTGCSSVRVLSSVSTTMRHCSQHLRNHRSIPSYFPVFG